MLKLFKKNQPNISEEWNRLGSEFAKAVNDMVNFGEENGWENWKGKEPKDKREHLASEVLKRLKEANKSNQIDLFRKHFPPAHSPFIDQLEAKAQSIEQLHFITDQKIVFLTGTPYEKRQAYILDGSKLLKLESNIDAIGKSMQGSVFAIASEGVITTTTCWQGEIIKKLQT